MMPDPVLSAIATEAVEALFRDLRDRPALRDAVKSLDPPALYLLEKDWTTIVLEALGELTELLTSDY